MQWAALAGLLLGVALLFGRVVDYPFLQWDDGIYVTQRPALQRLANGDRSAITELLSPREALHGRFWEYFPLRDLSYAVDAYRGGMNPRLFHQLNLWLHLLCVLMVYVVARGLGLAPAASWLASAFFALHPLTVEPVAWVSARKDLLYTLLALGALGCWLAWLRRIAAQRRAIVTASGFTLTTLGAFASKGPGVIVPFLAAWMGYRQGGLRKNRRLLGLLALLSLAAAGWLALGLLIGQRNTIITAGNSNIGLRVWHACGAPADALWRIALPLHLSPSVRGTFSASGWGTLSLMLLGALLWRRGVRPPAIVTTLAGCTLLALLPTSGLIEVAQLRADRFLYLPLAFVAMLVAVGLTQLLRSRPRVLALVAAVWLLALSWQTHRYLAVWANDITLWKHVLRSDPDHPIANGQLAASAIEQGQLDLAKRLLDRAIASGAALAPTWSNLGRWWQYRAADTTAAPTVAKRETMMHRAEAAFRRALEIDPRYAPAWTQLGILARSRGDLPQAERLWRRAIGLPRAPLEAALQLAQILETQGHRQQARQVIANACRVHPLDQRCNETY